MSKNKILSLAKKLVHLNFEIIATKGTANFLKDNSILVKTINKVKEGNPHIVDALLKNESFSRTIQTGFDEETGDPIFETEEFEIVE